MKIKHVILEGLDKITKTTIQKKIIGKLVKDNIIIEHSEPFVDKAPFKNFYDYLKSNLSQQELAHLMTANRLFGQRILKEKIKNLTDNTNAVIIQSRSMYSTMAYNISKLKNDREKELWDELYEEYNNDKILYQCLPIIIYFRPNNLKKHIEFINSIAEDDLEKKDLKFFEKTHEEYEWKLSDDAFPSYFATDTGIEQDTKGNVIVDIYHLNDGKIKYKISDHQGSLLNQDELVELLVDIINKKEFHDANI